MTTLMTELCSKDSKGNEEDDNLYSDLLRIIAVRTLTTHANRLLYTLFFESMGF